MMSVRLTQFSHGGGCGCKIAPAVLAQLLAASTFKTFPADLLVGTETSDDAAVYRLNPQQAIVATTDFSHLSSITRVISDALLPPMPCPMSMPWAAAPLCPGIGRHN